LRSAIAVSVAGIAAPFALGAILPYSLTADATFFTAGVSPIEAMLFTGASMSITAFPMLARIIYTLKSI
jgi:Kef-type K+ transport system membrane component KefB